MENIKETKGKKERRPKVPLTKEQKKVILEEKIKKMKLQVRQLETQEKKQERKERTKELIQIGAIISQFYDRKKLLAYLKNPKYMIINTALSKRELVTEEPKNSVYTIHLPLPNEI